MQGYLPTQEGPIRPQVQLKSMFDKQAAYTVNLDSYTLELRGLQGYGSLVVIARSANGLVTGSNPVCALPAQTFLAYLSEFTVTARIIACSVSRRTSFRPSPKLARYAFTRHTPLGG